MQAIENLPKSEQKEVVCPKCGALVLYVSKKTRGTIKLYCRKCREWHILKM